MTARYQYGNLTIRKRKKGPDLWQFRWMENGKPKSVLIGTVQKYPTQADVERAVERLRITINAENPQQHFYPVTVGGLTDRFMQDYAPKRCRQNTQNNYRGLFDNHIRPKWESVLVQNVKTTSVEDWLETYPHSRQVKSHVRNLMHTLFQAAIRWDVVERNPIDLVRQSGNRLKKPRVLTRGFFRALLEMLQEPYKTMVMTIACLRLRVSELVALQWGDLDFENFTIQVVRGFVRGVINPTKSDASEGVLPLDPDLAEVLLAHKKNQVTYVSDSDYVFANESGNVRWPESMLTDHVKPAAMKAGISNIGWHTFRHTYSTLLHSLGTKPAVQKELLAPCEYSNNPERLHPGNFRGKA